MALKLMYITNNPTVAKIAEKAGVDLIFLDLEKIGKEERQYNIDSVKSNHSIADIKVIRDTVTSTQILVRVNPIYPDSKNEIDAVIKNGADIVMLPMWKTEYEVSQFIKFIDGRAKAMLLLETKEAADIISDIVKMDGIDFIHIGLNDLHLSCGKTFIFEPLADGTVESICNTIRNSGIPYGFGGIARLGEGMLPAQNIIAEHYRLNSSAAILSRCFCDAIHSTSLNIVEEKFVQGIKEIRDYEAVLKTKDDDFFQSNHALVCEKVGIIVENIKNKKKIS
jgi:2-keto-3-deoxy-L-rhamnonate aldolase RhmA